jgi:hypothetical protein
MKAMIYRARLLIAAGLMMLAAKAAPRGHPSDHAHGVAGVFLILVKSWLEQS